MRCLTLVFALALALAAPTAAPRAHCDTLDGPVVLDARAALEAKDATSVLKWVGPADEAEIRSAFAKAVAARAAGGAAREVADTWFLETLVRVHRRGEGAPFDGLKPAGSASPAAMRADAALAGGDGAALAEDMAARAKSGIAERYARVRAASEHKDHNAEAGRAWVAAYVDYVHFVERVDETLSAPAHAGEHHH